MQTTLEIPTTFTVPPELEAREPPEARGLTRDGVRLLVSYRAAHFIEHARFKDLPRFLLPGDAIIVNSSRTLPAALVARKEDGGEITVHLSTPLPDGRWIVEPRGESVEAGQVLLLPEGACLTLLEPYPQSTRLWIARLRIPDSIHPYLTRWGKPIRYAYMRQPWPIEAYQTVYADEPGSAEMPSAGRGFTGDLMARLIGQGVIFARIILHAGVASLEAHEPLTEEYFRVPGETAALVNAVHRGGRVIAVGTTVVRALESATKADGAVVPAEGWTKLVVSPERGIRSVDGLLTGFHEPRSTHLAMLAALAGREHVARVYREALNAGYLWHEFGDLHLILP